MFEVRLNSFCPTLWYFLGFKALVGCSCRLHRFLEKGAFCFFEAKVMDRFASCCERLDAKCEVSLLWVELYALYSIN
jgi:hypothetical protein